MSNPLPYALLFGSWTVFWDQRTNVPLAGGTLTFTAAGSSSAAQLVYSDAGGSVSLGSVVTLNAAGQPQTSVGAPTGIFIRPTGYQLNIRDGGGVLLETQDSIADVSAIFLATLSQQLSSGSKNVSCPYTILPTDNTVTVATTGAVFLPASAVRGAAGLPLTIINIGSATVDITPITGDMINSQTAGTVFTLAGATGNNYPTKTLTADGVSSWLNFGGA